MPNIVTGRASIWNGELRCKAAVTRFAVAKDGTQTPVGAVCNRLVCKENRDKEIAGQYKCPKCSQMIEVTRCLEQSQ